MRFDSGANASGCTRPLGRRAGSRTLPGASLRAVDDGLRSLLLTLSPRGRDNLRQALILDQSDRDAIASELLRYGDGWADVIDMLTMYPDARRRWCG